MDIVRYVRMLVCRQRDRIVRSTSAISMLRERVRRTACRLCDSQKLNHICTFSSAVSVSEPVFPPAAKESNGIHVNCCLQFSTRILLSTGNRRMEFTRARSAQFKQIARAHGGEFGRWMALVVAMAHLWSKFTKCLRPSEGAFDTPAPLPPNVGPSSAQCRRVIRYYYVVAITTSRKRRGLPSPLRPLALFNYRSLIRASLCRCASASRFIPLLDLSQRPGELPAHNECNVDNEISPVAIIDLPTTRYAVLYLRGFLDEERDRGGRKTPRRINRRALPSKVRSRLQLDFIYGFYSECI